MLLNEVLQYHWALDEQASDVVTEHIKKQNAVGDVHAVIESLDARWVAARDVNRQMLATAFTGHSSLKVVILGPCSEDYDVDYEPLYDYIEEVQEENPDALVVLRINDAKPRTETGWTGLWYALEPRHRKRMFDVFREAFNRGIPIVTEVTEGVQLGGLVPYLSGFWLGARDNTSTSLRGKFSAYHLANGVKNGNTGDFKIVESAVNTIRSNSDKNDGSGVYIDGIGLTDKSSGTSPVLVPIGSGNPNNAIFARGYELPKGLSPSEKRIRAFRHLSDANVLSEILDCAVLIDGTHSVPPMFDIDPKHSDRFIAVLQEIHTGIKTGEIARPRKIAGVMGEIGPVEGRTDPNYVLDDKRKEILREMIKTTLALI